MHLISQKAVLRQRSFLQKAALQLRLSEKILCRKLQVFNLSNMSLCLVFHFLFTFFSCAGSAMTSLLDSTAHFSDRCGRLGLTPAFVNALSVAGVDSLTKIAFVLGQPGQPILNQDVEGFHEMTALSL